MRLVLVGVNVLVFSLSIFFYGLWISWEVLAGVGASGVVLGIVLVGLGLLYIEPLTVFLGDGLGWCLDGLLRIGEDAGVLDRFVVVGCPRGDSVVVALVHSPRVSLPSCDDIAPGLGIAGDAVFLGVSVKFKELEDVSGVSELLEELLVRRYGVVFDVNVEDRGSVVVVEAVGTRREVGLWLGYPLNPLDLVIVGGVASNLRGGVAVSSRNATGNVYRVVLKRLG